MADFLDTIRAFIQKYQLFEPDTPLIVAVSGGIDSVVLCHVLHRLHYKFTVAHVNFGLRHHESDNDELFVKKLAQSYDAPVAVLRTDAKLYARTHGTSIQMAARTLRYEWFDALATAAVPPTAHARIATAHHRTDHTETLLLNQVRGTGIAGMHGILTKNNHIVRPLLAVQRTQIADYADRHHLQHTEDSSNATTKYKRNLLRHAVLPVLHTINPRLHDTMWQNSQRMQATEYFARAYISDFQQKMVLLPSGDFLLEYKYFDQHPHAVYLLFEVLKDYDFTLSQIENLMDNVQKKAVARVFLTDKWQIFMEHTHLILQMRKEVRNVDIIIKNLEELRAFTYNNVDIKGVVMIEKPVEFIKNCFYFDADVLSFAIEVRQWRTADKFAPLGMHGRKKLVSDYLTDAKIPAHLRQNAWVMTDADNEILGVACHNHWRSSEKTKITACTQKIIAVSMDTF
jgi:tRNA(Ile)-lysidine synthase